jgi:3-dehydroquinate dehydratase-2
MTLDKARILVLHGPNLNLLGRREPQVYGSATLDDINQQMQARAVSLGVDLEILQTNHEGVMVDAIHKTINKFQGIIINPAAFTHYSVAVRDALAAVEIPIIEVHLSNIYSREEFRHHSIIAPVVTGQISGLGSTGYLLALEAISQIIGGR